VGVREVRWDEGGTVRAGDYNFFYGNGNKNQQLRTEFYVYHRIVSAVTRVESVSNRVSYTDVHAQSMFSAHFFIQICVIFWLFISVYFIAFFYIFRDFLCVS
jgi:hypothetical protein